MPTRIANRTYGTISGDQQKEMTGLDFVQGLADGTLPLNTIARTLGYDITEAKSGRVVVAAEPKDIHLNPAAPCMVVSRPQCSTAAWGSRSNRLWKKVSAPRPLSSRFHSFGRSRRKQARSRLRARSSAGGAASVLRKVASRTARAVYSSIAPPPA